MKAYDWSVYSKAYCEKIKCMDNSNNNQLKLYSAFNKAEWYDVYYIVYKNKVVMEYPNYNEAYHSFIGMLDLLKHLGEEGELK